MASIYMEEHKIDVALIQDALVRTTDDKHRLYSFPAAWKYLASTDLRAWIVVRNPNIIFTFLARTETAIFITCTTTDKDKKEDVVILGSQYIPPSKDPHFTQHLDEWQSIITQRHPFYMCGDLNANSTLWGCPKEDRRGSALIEFLVANNITILNDPESPPTFRTSRAKGWPDLTITNAAGTRIGNNWKVEDVETGSDHKYITFEIQTKPQQVKPRRFKTKFGHYKKFSKILHEHKESLTGQLERAHTQFQLDTFTDLLIQTIRETAAKCFKLKLPKQTHDFKWFTPELRAKRNRLTALVRKHNRLTQEEQLRNITNIKRERALFKKHMRQAKRKAWQNYCTRTAERFGSAQKIATGKTFKPDEIQLELQGSDRSRQTMLSTLTEKLFGPADQTHAQTLVPDFNAADDKHFTRAEVKNAIYAFDTNKAPGTDCIDFRLLRATYTALPGLITLWSNKCLDQGYFPKTLRQGEVVYFLKQGKSPSEAKSYRPICLLPTLGKGLEKLIVQRLVHYLESHNFLNSKQFGFREGRSCEQAIDKLISSCVSNMQDKKLTTIVSVDIKGAFDNIAWNKLTQVLEQLQCPSNLGKVICTYLSERSLSVNWGTASTTHNIVRGCPQGSCLGPVLWNLVANTILNDPQLKNADVTAYADDFAFVFSGPRRLDIEREAKHTLTIFSKRISDLGLELSAEKSYALTLNKPFQLKREPVIHINKKSVHHVKKLRYLGVILDRCLNFVAHAQHIKEKLARMHMNIQKLAAKTWGISTSLQKVWYQTVIERIMVYGAGVWAHRITKEGILKLISIQRMFLLQISRGYRTISAEALQVITGIPPIDVTLKMENINSRILGIKDISTKNEWLGSKEIQLRAQRWLIHPAEDTSESQVNTKLNAHEKPENTLAIYTDGSKTDSGVGAAFCVIRGPSLIHTNKRKLHAYNTVFQAELLAIDEALNWLITNTQEDATIFSDSFSSLQGILKHRNNNKQIIKIKHKLKFLSPRVRLAHVKAHAGTEGNELADRLAKEATELEESTISLPAPPSYLKAITKRNRMASWQEKWADSTNGRHTFALLPKAQHNNIHLNPATTAFLSGHGPFPTYLCKFMIRDSETCPCGARGTPTHYYFECSLTAQWHLKQPSPEHWDFWTRRTVGNTLQRRKLQEIYDFLMDLSART